MNLKIFNTLSKKLEIFVPLNEKFDGLCLSNGINAFFEMDSLPEIVTELIFIGKSWLNNE